MKIKYGMCKYRLLLYVCIVNVTLAFYILHLAFYILHKFYI